MNDQVLKEQVKSHWNNNCCGTEVTEQQKFSKQYFDEIEAFRYKIEPEIFSFAQFTRYHNKKVLEVGVGAGTDFLQWVRAGAIAYGVDLTQEAVDHVKNRLQLYNLHTQEVQVADAEQLPYKDNTFDLSYSWGVIHHSPNTQKCLEELIRVTKPGGTIKVMVYHRRSLFAWYQWILHALLKGKPWRTVKDVLFEHQESKGTKAYTYKEARALFANILVKEINISSPITNHDLLYYHKSKFVKWCAQFAATLFGWSQCGWFLCIELKRL